MKRGLIFLNGDPPNSSVLSALNFSEAFIVCADGAYDYLMEFAIPDVILGDFDSIHHAPRGKKIKRFPVDKDYTDGHLAVLETVGHADEVEIYGAGGGRPDHEYANYALLPLAASKGIRAVIKGSYDVYYVDGEFTATVEKNMTVSIVPYTDTAHIISTEGLKFSADDLTLDKLHLIGMSNTSTADTVKLRVGSGGVLVFIQRRQ